MLRPEQVVSPVVRAFDGGRTSVPLKVDPKEQLVGGAELANARGDTQEVREAFVRRWRCKVVHPEER